MEFDDDDGLDDEPASPLLPPDDRLWRHPSEMSAAPGATAVIAAPKAHEQRTMTVVALSSAISVLLTLGLVAAIGPLRTERIAETMLAPAVESDAKPVTVADVSGLADQLRPTIVRIEATGSNGSRWGSAVLIRSDGVMLTAAHLVAGAKAVRATLADGTTLSARVIGFDDDIGIAVLDLTGDGFSPATIGSATRLRVGEPAITLGAPGDDGGATVTAGVVGGLGRGVEHGGRLFLDMLQIDRPIAPGCNGGAVVNAQGTLIAIAAVNILRDGMVLGYAIPIDVARLSAEQLLENGKVSRVWLGIEGEDLGQRRSQELDVAGGVVVKRIKADSPAARVNLGPGAVIIAVDGQPVPTMAALVLALRGHQAGSTVTLSVLRDGKTSDIAVTLTERPTTTPG